MLFRVTMKHGGSLEKHLQKIAICLMKRIDYPNRSTGITDREATAILEIFTQQSIASKFSRSRHHLRVPKRNGVSRTKSHGAFQRRA